MVFKKKIKNLAKQNPDVKADLICQQIAEGRTITELCTGKSWYPSHAEFQNWLDQSEELTQKLILAEKLRLNKIRDSLFKTANRLEKDIQVESNMTDKAALIRILASTIKQLLEETEELAKKEDRDYVVFEDIEPKLE